MKLFTFVASINRTNHITKNETKERSILKNRNIFLFLGFVLSLSFFALLSQKEKPLPSQEFFAQANKKVIAKKAGVTFSSPRELGKINVTISRKSVKVKASKSINKVVGIHPENDQQLNATLAFQYNESDLNGLKEEDLILYSSQDKGETWQPHKNSQVNTITNTIRLEGISHFSLWTAAPPAIPQLTIDKDTQTPNILPNGEATYTIVITNAGTVDVTKVSVDDHLPAGFLDWDTDPAYSFSGGAIINASEKSFSYGGGTTPKWGTYFDIPVGGSATITFTVAAGSTEGTFDNTATTYVTISGTTYSFDDEGDVAQDADTPAGEDPEDDEDVTVSSGSSLTANDDEFISGTSGGTTPSVFLNDDAVGTSPATNALLETPTIVDEDGLTSVTIDDDGIINVPANTTPGTYNVQYAICLTANTSVCDTAIASIQVLLDTDNDGIADIIDLDADNDGILNIDEIEMCTSVAYTGSDATITVPAKAIGMMVKVWGAGGGHEIKGYAGIYAKAGMGGYTYAVFDNTVVVPGTQFTVVVGEGGNLNGRPDQDSPEGVYGFGSISGHDQGGGLSGIFTGTSAVTATDQARALIIAGGGSGYESSGNGGGGLGVDGYNGNSPSSGGEVGTMLGSDDTNTTLPFNQLPTSAHLAGGGGGYEGGGRRASLLDDYSSTGNYGPLGNDIVAGAGGSGFVSSLATYSQILYTPDFTLSTPPNTSDPSYVAGIGVGGLSQTNTIGGNGLVVICWIIDTDGDGLADYLDLDSDNDGISDLVEAGHDASVLDTNNDGMIDDITDNPNGGAGDADSDGLSDLAEAAYGADAGVTPSQTDGDGIANFIDLDSDNDGIPDAVEAQPTSGYTTNDGDVSDNVDANGIPPYGLVIPNVDADDTADTLPDYLDTDSDGDGVDDTTESGLTLSGTIQDGIDSLIHATYADPDGDVSDPINYLTNTDADATDADYRSLSTIDAVDDTYTGINPTAGGTTPSVFLNDNADGTSPATNALLETPTIVNMDGLTGVTIDDDGIITIPANTTPGTYNVEYAICLTANTSICDTATTSIVILPPLDTDNDGIADIIDLDDDNDGILDSEECNPQYASFTGLSSAGGTFNTDINGNALQTSITVAAPIAIDPQVNPGTVDVFSQGTNGEVLRLEDNQGYAIGGGLELGLTFSRPDIPIISTGAGASNLNQSDEYRFTPQGVSANFQWIVISSNHATIIKSGIDIVIAGDLTSGALGDEPFAEFKIVANEPITGLTIKLKNHVGESTGFNSARFDFSFCTDTDGDGIPNIIDLDSDNDGISDLVEAGHDASVLDTNNDGMIDDITDNPNGGAGDADSDGLSDLAEAAYGADAGVTPSQTDGDGIANFIDLDSDNDGIPDAVEAQPTAGYTTNDGDVSDNVDANGIPSYGLVIPNVDTDDTADTLPDYLDLDSDGDGIDDTTESGLTLSGTINDGIDSSIHATYADPDGDVNDPINYLTNTDADATDADYRSLSTIDAVDDTYTGIDPTVGGTTTQSVFLNDDADGVSPATNALLETPTIINEGGLTGVTIDDDGIITVPANTTPGTYDVQYAICLTANTSICDTATASITVDAPSNDYIDFTIRYNFETGQYEVYGKPNFTQENYFVGGGSQVSLVLPESVGDSPLSITTVAGGAWFDNSQIYAPDSDPNNDFHGVASNGSQMDWVEGEEQLLYTFKLPEGCVENIRIFENTTDPQSSDAGMGGGDFNNYFADVNFTDFYHANYDNAGTDCTPPNTPPSIVSDTISTNEDTPVLVNILENDVDAEGLDPTTVSVLMAPSHGTYTLSPTTGAVTYTPDPNYVGQDTMRYKVCDQGTPVFCDSAFVYIDVLPINDAPTIVQSPVVTPEDTSVTFCPTLSDPDFGDVLTVSSCGGPYNGIMTVDANNCITYTPNSDFYGTDSMCIMVCDAAGLCDTTPVFVPITITPVNDPPIAVDDNQSTPEDTPVMVSVLSNDQDPEGLNPATVAIVTSASNGVLVVDPVSGEVTYTPNPNYVGQDTFEYSVCDTGTPIYCDTAQVIIDITETNDPPTIVQIPVTTPEDTPVKFCPTIDDIDTGDALTVLICGQPTNGTAAVDMNGCIDYIPFSNYSGSDEICVTVCDAAGLCDSVLVPITITPVNDAPIANDDADATNEDTPVVINVLGNDTDVEGLDATTVAIVTPPTNGTTSVDPVTGEVTYTPNPNYTGQDTLTYAICDTGMPVLCDTAQVVINIGMVNDPPVATDDPVLTDEDTPIVVDVLDNDTDLEGIDSTSVVIVTPPTHGTTSVDPVTGEVTYTPNPNFFGQDTITYAMCDTGMPVLCDTAQIVVTVDPVNDAPIANDDTDATNEDTPVVINVLGNDTDVEGLDATTVAIVTPPVNGTTSVDPVTGEVTYTPNPDFFGLDTITYVVCDTGMPVLCDTAQVVINIGMVNDPPVATDDPVLTDEDTPIVVDVLDNDTDLEGIDSTSVVIVTPPTHGTTSVDPVTGEVTYTPNPNFFGQDTITYAMCDTGMPVLCDTAQIVVTVDPVNDAPIANDDTDATNEDTPVVINVLGNDTDVEGLDATTVAIVTPPVNGTTSVDPVTGEVTYTPNPNYTGQDTLTYAICDTGMPVLCDTAQVVINIGMVNDPPVATDDPVLTDEDTPIVVDVLDNDTDLEGIDSTSVVIVTPPTHGTTSVDPVTGEVTYTPNPNFFGQDTITYAMCDTGMPVLCDTAQIVVTVAPVNDAPIANDDSATTNEDTPVVVTVLGNDTDVEGLDSTTVAIVTPPTNGTTSVDPVTGEVTYTPNPDFFGLDTITYVVCDTGMPVLCDTAEVVITIGETNTLYALGDINQTMVNVPVSGNVLINDNDPQGHALVVNTTPVSEPEFGTLVLNADGSYVYTPDPNYAGSDKFYYEVCDNGTPVVCDTAEVIINIIEIFADSNNPPTGGADHFEMESGETLVSNLLSNDFDIDLDSITINTTPIMDPSHGTIVINSDGTFEYTPNAEFVGSDTIYYEICDDGTPVLCDTVEIAINIKENDGENDTYATDDTGFGEMNQPIIGNVLFNDYDPEGDDKLLRVVAVSNPQNGTVALAENGAYIYTPNQGYTGNDYFVYAICDDGTPVACDTAVVYLTIISRETTPTNPVAVDDEATTTINSPVRVPVLLNDTIFETVNVKIIDEPTNGIVEIDTNGVVVYIPNADYCSSDPDSFVYEICAGGHCDSATVYVTVNCDGLIVHDGFSPNRDGINDRFIIENINSFPKNKLKVYNRWGNLVFEKAPYDNSWDATWNQDSPVPDGTYFYVWKNGEGKTYSGYIEIHR